MFGFKRCVERDAGDGAQGLFEAMGELRGAFPDAVQPDVGQVAGGKGFIRGVSEGVGAVESGAGRLVCGIGQGQIRGDDGVMV